MWRVDKVVQAHLQSITDSVLKHVEPYNLYSLRFARKCFSLTSLKIFLIHSPHQMYSMKNMIAIIFFVRHYYVQGGKGKLHHARRHKREMQMMKYKNQQ